MGRNYTDVLEPGTDGRSTETTDDLFSVLSDANRRFVLAHLSQRDTPPALDPLAGALCEWDDDLSHEDARIALHHVHLPKLEDADLVEYGEQIELTDRAPESLALLDRL
ncbi:DUF7344 domain-containing protein [Halosimplex salinum]|uniref:DUF7344 domain-containing protein n=1 Tax=Halosimplex salinum TaxID=1710538 RepID=UPI0019D05C23|nr:hypothetical protein [Halosimplex salinum]